MNNLKPNKTKRVNDAVAIFNKLNSFEKIDFVEKMKEINSIEENISFKLLVKEINANYSRIFAI